MEIEKGIVYYIEKDEECYTRHNAGNWTKVMGESDEPVYNCEDLETEFQRALANADTSDSNCTIHGVSCRFSDADVRNIVLEMQNAAMYAHSHNLSRFETRIGLQKVKKKWKL